MRKKLFAIIMSAMMMVTFMPAMAFATYAPATDATKVVVGEHYNSVTYGGKTYKTVKTLEMRQNGGSAAFWTGKVFVNAVGDGVQNPDSEFVNLWEAEYYPLTGANTYKAKNNYVLTYDQFDPLTKSQFTSAFGSESTVDVTLKLASPAETKYTETKHYTWTGGSHGHWNYASTDAPVAKVDTTTIYAEDITIPGYTQKMQVPGYDFDKYEAQEFKLAVSIVPGVNATAKVDGEYNSKAMKFVAKAAKKAADMTDADYTLDGKAIADIAYDGAEHVIAQKAYDGITSTFKLWSNGQYVDVANPVVKDAGTYNFKAIAVKGTETPKETTFSVTVKKAAETTKVQFEENAALEGRKYDVPETFDAFDFVEFTNNAKAVAANADLLKAYLKDYYKITLKSNKYTPEVITGTLAVDTEKAGKLTTADKDALIAKYGVLYKNFTGNDATRNNIGTAMFGTANTTATFYVTGGDIEWVKAPLAKNYYNKSGKLAKTYTFTVEAKAASKVTYKLSNGGSMITIDKATGKVTVKKGLKVGTYKVVVTAKAGKSTESYEMTVKMAKKK